MPIVELRNFEEVDTPGDHANPATRQNVDDAMQYHLDVGNMLFHDAQEATHQDLAAAQLHLHDTCTSFLQGAQGGAQVQQINVQGIMQGLLDEMRNQMNIFREEMNQRFTETNNRLTTINNRLTVIEERLTTVDNRVTTVDDRLTTVDNRLTNVQDQVAVVNNRLTHLEGRVAAVNELTIETAVLSARNTNVVRRRGTTLVPVRYPDGRLPEGNRPPLVSLRAIQELNPAVARSYANVHSYNLQLPPNATDLQVRAAIANHIGARH